MEELFVGIFSGIGGTSTLGNGASSSTSLDIANLMTSLQQHENS